MFQKFNNLKIKQKLTLGFSIVTISMIIVGLAGYNGIRGINHFLKAIFAVNLPSIDLLVEVDRDLQQLLVAERTMIFSDVTSKDFPELLKEYETNLKQTDERWQKYKAIAATPEEKALIASFEAAREQWQSVSRSVVDNRLADTRIGRTTAIDLTLGQAKQKFEAMRDVIDQLTEINLAAADEANKTADRT